MVLTYLESVVLMNISHNAGTTHIDGMSGMIDKIEAILAPCRHLLTRRGPGSLVVEMVDFRTVLSAVSVALAL